MEPPKPNSTPNEINLKLKEKDILYNLLISTEKDSLVIKVSEGDNVPALSYSAKYTLDDLIKQSNFFKLFNSPEQLIPELSDLCKEKKISLKKKNTSIILMLSLPLRVIEEVYLTIPQEEVDPEIIISNLCQTVNELKRKIRTLGTISEEQLQKNLKSPNIFLDEEEKNMVCDWILETMKCKDGKVEMKLLYKVYKLEKGGRFSASSFHSYCNNKGYTLTLVRNTKGYRCGGFASQSWSSSGSTINDPNAFLFSLEFKEKYPSYDGNSALYDAYNYGPTFGSSYDLYIADNCTNNNSSYCNFPYHYCGTRARALSGGAYNFTVDELEVYQINIDGEEEEKKKE